MMFEVVEVRESVFNSVTEVLSSIYSEKRTFSTEEVCTRLPDISESEIQDCLRCHSSLKEAGFGNKKIFTFGKRQPIYSKELGASNEPVYQPPRQVLIDG